MSIRTLEAEILRELRNVSSNNKIRQKDIMEWRTGKDSVKAQDGEEYFWLPVLGVGVAVKKVK